MKPVLSEEQVSLINDKLTELELVYFPLKEEYLDHICCQIEFEIAKGQTFEQASNVIFEAIKKDELKELQEKTILFTNQKSRRMQNLMFISTLLLIFLTSTIFFLKKENSLVVTQLPSPEELAAEFLADSFLNQKNIQICNGDLIKEKQETILFNKTNDPPNISPLDDGFKVTSEFGMRFHPVFKTKKFHRGIDFIAPIGTPVLATADGVILKSIKNKKGYGHHIIIQHDHEFKTLYAHLKEIMVSEGQAIRKGAVIATVGSTGNSSKPHLHYEVIKEGKRVDPIAYCHP